jgi:hypothetical protein
VGPQSKKKALPERKGAKLEEIGYLGETAMTTTLTIQNFATAMTHKWLKTVILRRQKT